MIYKKIICFDIDGVICITDKRHNYKNSRPIIKNINFINQLYSSGYFIVLFTARFMGRCNEKINLAKKKCKHLTVTQLKNWRVNYHKLKFGKPSYDIFVDDKNLGFEYNWIGKLKKKLNISKN